MNRILTIILLALLASGCSSDKKEKVGKAKTESQKAAQKLEKEKQRQEELQAARLDEAKQNFIFDSEHVTFVIEQVFGKAWKKAFKDGDLERMQTFFFPEFVGQTIENEKLSLKSASVVREETRTHGNGPKEVDVSGMVSYLGSVKKRFEKLNRLKFRVLKIAQPVAGQPIWECRILVDAVGESAPSKPYQYESEQVVIFEIENEEEIDEKPVISDWKIEKEIFRSADQYLTEEVTSQVLLDKVQMPDNWKLSVDETEQYWFQYSVEDFNLDGKLDLAASSNHLYPRLYTNGVGSRFVEVADSRNVVPAAGKARIGNSFGCAWLDYDNDGYPDLINGPILFKNMEGKSFQDVTVQSGLMFYAECMGIIVADYDCDGLVDIYALYQSPNVAEDPDAPKQWVNETMTGAENQLWKNMGKGRFENVTKKANAGGGKRHTHAANWFFYDDDHYPDLYIANDFGKNVLLRNKGDGTFEDVSLETKTEGYSTSMGVSTGDLDNDGRNEIYVANMYSKMGRRIIGQVNETDYPEGIFEQIKGSCAGNRLYTRSDEGNEFKEIGETNGVHDVGWAFGPDFVDLDGDGLLDIYATTGFMSFRRDKPDG